MMAPDLMNVQIAAVNLTIVLIQDMFKFAIKFLDKKEKNLIHKLIVLWHLNRWWRSGKANLLKKKLNKFLKFNNLSNLLECPVDQQV
jgi:hypothetical protein